MFAYRYYRSDMSQLIAQSCLACVELAHCLDRCFDTNVPVRVQPQQRHRFFAGSTFIPSIPGTYCKRTGEKLIHV